MKHIFLGFVLVLNVAILFKVQFWSYLFGSVQLWDFDNYYRTVIDVLAGAHPYQLPYMQISGPPLVLVPFIPFSWLPLLVGRSIMNTVSLVAGLGSSWLLTNFIGRQRSLLTRVTVTLLFNALLLISFPTRFNFITGQPNLIIMWLVTWLLVTDDQRVKGFSAGVLAILKTNYLLIFVSFLKKTQGALAVAVSTLVIGFVVSLSVFNPQGTISFLTNRGPSFAFTPAQTTDVDYYNQSLRATMARLHLGHWYPVLFISLSLLGVIYLLKTGDQVSSIILSLLIAPVLWQHYIVVVYPVVILIAHRLWQAKTIDRWFVLAVILLALHFPKLHGYPAVFPYNLLASHYFLGLGILLAQQIRLNLDSRRGRIVA